MKGQHGGGCVCFFHRSVTALSSPGFRKEGWNLQRPGPQSAGREEGLAGSLVTQLPSFYGKPSQWGDEFELCAAVGRGRPIDKDVLVAFK